MNNPIQHELAREPEDLARFFVARANAGDVEGLAALYEPDAVLATGRGEIATGTEEIRGFYARLLASRPRFEPGVQTSLRNGRLALTSSRLGNGNVTAEIARQQADGTWLWTLDQPMLAMMA